MDHGVWPLQRTFSESRMFGSFVCILTVELKLFVSNARPHGSQRGVKMSAVNTRWDVVGMNAFRQARHCSLVYNGCYLQTLISSSASLSPPPTPPQPHTHTHTLGFSTGPFFCSYSRPGQSPKVNFLGTIGGELLQVGCPLCHPTRASEYRRM